ncbi:[FeFe] hydrogenase, group A [Mycoplasmatota bacterium]|nr:[FeFe] hydrogenase, group A [Mycoplasmatota bacterium]
MAKIILNGKSISAKNGQTILSVARENGVEIPTLCFLEEINEIGFCRICVVEVEGEKDLVSACNTAIKSGMVVNTDSQRVLDSRQATLTLLAKKHRFNCWVCPRGDGTCDFYNLLKDYCVDSFKFDPAEGRHDCVVPGTGIYQDQTKCILCKRCVAVCNNVVTAKVYKFRDEEGTDPIVSPTPRLPFDEAGCIFCGQCTKVCPTGTLAETDHIERVEQAIRNPKKHVIVQMAPAIRAAIGEPFGYPIGTPVREVEGKMYRALKILGFDEVTDTNFSADLTIMEEGTEFIDRVKNSGTLPLFTSCSPGWVRYIEMYRPEYLANLSSAKSPHMMHGAILKNFYAPKSKDIAPEDVYVVSIMPCTAKKYEISRPEMEQDGIRDVDAVLTTRELARMIKKHGIDFVNLEDYKPENKFAEYTGAGTIFGASGGVMEAAVRTVYEILEGESLGSIDLEMMRGVEEDIKEATLKLPKTGLEVNVAIVHGGKGIKKMFEILDKGEKEYHFIEFMGCPGGCVNGGGQPIVKEEIMDQFKVAELRASALYDSDQKDTEFRRSHLNKAVKWTYDEWLEKPGSHVAHKYLHTNYSQKKFRKE